MKTIETPVPFTTNNVIVDVEVSNNLAELNWDYEKGETCVVGIFFGDKITQFMLMDKNKLPEFRKVVNDFLLSFNDRRMFALNIRMERGCLKTLLGYPLQFHEISPFAGPGTKKEYFFNYMVKRNKTTNESIGFVDPIGGKSELVEKFWKEHRYEEVRQHNLCCLTKEALILEHNDFIRNEHSHLLDERGWLKRGVSLPSI